MGDTTLFLFIAVAAGIAMCGFLVVHRITKPLNLDEHQNFIDAMLNIVGTLVSIVLGLLVAAALDHYQVTEASVDAEASSAAEVYRLSCGLPEPTRTKIRELCTNYCMAVLYDEWPAMEKKEVSKKALFSYLQLFSEVATFHPSGEGESNLHSALISSLQQMGNSRRQRILVLHSPWNQHLMPVLFMCAAIMLAFAFLYVKRGAILHAILLVFVAIALGGNLGLVFLLSNPFSGQWKIQPRGFELNAQLMKEIKSAPDMLKALDKVKE